jgi:hypothetical protein
LINQTGLKSGGVFNKGKSLIWLEVVLNERWHGNFVTKKFCKNLKQMPNYAARRTGSIHSKGRVLACTAPCSQIVRSLFRAIHEQVKHSS